MPAGHPFSKVVPASSAMAGQAEWFTLSICPFKRKGWKNLQWGLWLQASWKLPCTSLGASILLRCFLKWRRVERKTLDSGCNLSHYGSPSYPLCFKKEEEDSSSMPWKGVVKYRRWLLLQPMWEVFLSTHPLAISIKHGLSLAKNRRKEWLYNDLHTKEWARNFQFNL